MNIGEVAARSGVNAKTIRYYENIGLIRPAPRAANGYRAFSASDLHTLSFVSRARGLGFSVGEVARLLELYHDRNRASADVKAIALEHVDRIERKIDELDGMRATLIELIENCHGDERPDCPILADLAGIGPEV